MRKRLEYMEESTERFQEKTAVADGIGAYNYRELSKRSRRIGSAIAARCKQNQPVADLAEKEADTMAALVAEVMNNVVELKVPLIADVQMGTNWAIAH